MLRHCKDMTAQERLSTRVFIQAPPNRGFIDVTGDCYAFDEELGEAYCFVRNASGRIEVDTSAREPKRKTLKGKLRIEHAQAA